ncbi:MAG TPA: endo-1,4-beta-xylanase [Bacteroidales bacterium]|nr:endo-1,4-beta-xylanase [Bacteroidales bacterium]
MKTRSLLKGTLFTFISGAAITAIMTMSSCGGGSGKPLTAADSLKGLKDFYKDYFPIGVAVSPRSLEGENGEFIKKNFNSLTPENVMKPALIQPEEGRFAWEQADQIVDFAQANGMKVRGHTLAWHNQTGEWMFKDSIGNEASKELLLARLEKHIKTVVGRYKGKIYAWDVVNEAIDNLDPAHVGYRQTQWYKICGDEFIAKAFQWAHEADPDAVLFYNEYNTENPAKREKTYEMLKKMLDQGVPIHGVGIQAHWNIGAPKHVGQLTQPGEGDFETGSTEDAIRESIDKFASLGLKVQITELDVSIYTSREDTLNIGFTPEREQKQIDFYNTAFKVFREKKDVLTGVTFWNLSDRGSWLDSRTPRRSKHYPLLFDENMKPKKAYWKVVTF